MSISGQSLFRTDDLTLKQIDLLFSVATQMQNEARGRGHVHGLIDAQRASQKVAALLFFEPSTRTRFSFETAAARLNLRTIALDSVASTSLAKGESLTDTIETILAMDPDLLIVRHAGNPEVIRLLQNVPCPVIIAGDGTDEHPTQALLDAFTLLRHRKDLKGEKLVFVGDVAYSRVAHSDRRLFKRLGMELAVCGPQKLLPQGEEWADVRRFTDLKDAIKWCDSLMALRLQQERHQKDLTFDLNDYIQNYRIDRSRLAGLKEHGLLMHPGPFVPEVDLSSDVLSDPRCVIREQVNSGVYVRMALMALILDLWGPS